MIFMNSKHNDKVKEVLLLILEEMEGGNYDWVLSGSTNLFIQGINIKASDIDIISTKEDIIKIEELFKIFSSKKIAYSESDKYRSYFGRLMIDGIQIDLMAELEFKTQAGNWEKSTSLENRKFMQFNSYQVPINPIGNELAFYKKMKRKDDDLKIKLIEKYKGKRTNNSSVM